MTLQDIWTNAIGPFVQLFTDLTIPGLNISFLAFHGILFLVFIVIRCVKLIFFGSHED